MLSLSLYIFTHGYSSASLSLFLSFYLFFSLFISLPPSFSRYLYILPSLSILLSLFNLVFSLSLSYIFMKYIIHNLNNISLSFPLRLSIFIHLFLSHFFFRYLYFSPSIFLLSLFCLPPLFLSLSLFLSLTNNNQTKSYVQYSLTDGRTKLSSYIT